MIITFNIELPISKFKEGDVLYKKNVNNKYGIYFYVSKIIYSGTWLSCPNCKMKDINCSRISYVVVYQKGSYRDIHDGPPIRPGKKEQLKEEDLKGFKTLFDFGNEIVSGDDKHTFSRRESEWRSYLSKYKKGDLS